ncbi:protein TIFY 6B-like isoform X1 [Syzygium oleosum]|uniref:protein TIFY 6B-like isoform X1 n=1 Tax=Syzygium oleosum TaxID=219896 RepID=UPI0024BB4786|nr:protein TIFY 6B-like isoform X1 [Syzygium oleosum]
MERDFLSLVSKDRRVSAKDEKGGDLTDPSSQMQWAFSNKVSGSSQLLSFKAFEEERPKKVIPDSQASSGSMNTQVPDVSNSKWKLQSREPQTSIIVDKKAQERCAPTIYPQQHLNGISVHYPQEVKIYSGSNRPNKTASLPFKSPVLQANFSSVRENMVCSPVNSQPVGGVLGLPPVSLLPSTSSTVGYTDYRRASKHPEMPAQMTIFYAGSVNVYDDVSPEKAQAIMLLAGNGPPLTHSKTLATTQGQGQDQGAISRISTDNSSRGNQPQNISALLGLPNLVSVTSQSGSPSGGKSTFDNDTMTMKPLGSFACPVNISETSKVVTPIGHGAASLLSTVALPQARKASLARFLEKRKERVISSSPYAVDKKSPACSTSTSSEISFSILNSSAPCPQSAAK